MKIKALDKKEKYKIVLRVDEDVNDALNKVLLKLEKGSMKVFVSKTRLINAILRKAMKDSDLEIEI